MSRKKLRQLVIECTRRAYMNRYGTLSGFGEVARFYNDDFFKGIRREEYWRTFPLRRKVGM